jgi:hypothetical protein
MTLTRGAAELVNKVVRARSPGRVAIEREGGVIDA